jgi:hypothetical protein
VMDQFMLWSHLNQIQSGALRLLKIMGPIQP